IPYEKHVAREIASLDAIERGHMSAAMAGDVKSANVCIRVSESRRKLLGIDRPAQLHVTGTMTTTSKLDSKIAELLGEMAAADQNVIDVNVVDQAALDA